MKPRLVKIATAFALISLAILPAKTLAQPLPSDDAETASENPLNSIEAVLETIAEPDPRELVLVSWGGRYGQAQQTALIDTFAQEGDTLALKQYKGTLASLQAIDGAWDLADFELPQLEESCNQLNLLPLDLEKLGLEPGQLIPGAVHRCGLASQAWSWSIFASEDLAPSLSAADFLDPKASSEVRGIVRDPKGLFEMVLLSRGVEPAQVYSTLSTPAGLNQVLTALAGIKESTEWYYTYADLEDAVKAGATKVAFGYTSVLRRASDSLGQGEPSLVDGPILYGLDYWGINIASQNVETAYDFLKHSVTVDAGLAFVDELAYLPANMDAYKLLNWLPSIPDSNSVLVFDRSWWNSEVGQAASQAFEAWLDR